ncbi:MAG: phage Gp37/Gp68 family protein [Patescibacteria group bacterium]|nr:phage Gp37/Gp68 family protein [Patescibacteria group bacterium]
MKLTDNNKRYTTIEWTDRTWNPVRGCTMVSDGCKHCYAMRQAHRFAGPGGPYEGLTEAGPQGPRWTGKIQVVPALLRAPLHWRTPCRVFVNSMSDLFHEDVPATFLDQVFAIMALTTQHTYQVLTKRPVRMREYFRPIGGTTRRDWVSSKIARITGQSFVATYCWPLENLWLGVSVEDQPTADARIPVLLQTPAAVRFVSVEPLLAPVDLSVYLRPDGASGYTRGVDWVIVGAESGPTARLCDLDWIMRILDQCRAAAVPAFVTQIGHRSGFRSRTGDDMTEWPESLRLRQWPP